MSISGPRCLVLAAILRIAPALVLLCGFTAPAGIAHGETVERLPAELLQKMMDWPAVGKFQESVLWTLDAYERNEGTVLLSDVTIAESRHAASVRAARIGRIMRYDLNEDGRVTRAEIVAGSQLPEPKDKHSRDWQRWSYDQFSANIWTYNYMQADTNHDDQIDFTELLANAKTNPNGVHLYPGLAAMKVFFAQDPDHDGRLTHAEANDIAAEIFDQFDRDHNGTIAGVEMQSLEEAWRTAVREEQ